METFFLKSGAIFSMVFWVIFVVHSVCAINWIWNEDFLTDGEAADDSDYYDDDDDDSNINNDKDDNNEFDQDKDDHNKDDHNGENHWTNELMANRKKKKPCGRLSQLNCSFTDQSKDGASHNLLVSAPTHNLRHWHRIHCGHRYKNSISGRLTLVGVIIKYCLIVNRNSSKLLWCSLSWTGLGNIYIYIYTPKDLTQGTRSSGNLGVPFEMQLFKPESNFQPCLQIYSLCDHFLCSTH